MTKGIKLVQTSKIMTRVCVDSGERNSVYISIFTGLYRIRRSLIVNCCKQERCLAPYQGIQVLNGDDKIVSFSSFEETLMAA